MEVSFNSLINHTSIQLLSKNHDFIVLAATTEIEANPRLTIVGTSDKGKVFGPYLFVVSGPRLRVKGKLTSRSWFSDKWQVTSGKDT
jgi:hypothetical protein